MAPPIMSCRPGTVPGAQEWTHDERKTRMHELSSFCGGLLADSEGSFLPDRAVQMAESLLRRYTGPCSSNREGSTDRPSGPLSVCNARSAEERPVNPARQGHLDAGHVFAAGAVGQAATTSLPPAAAMERLPEGTPPSPLDAAGAGGATEALQEGRQAPVGDALSSCAAPCKDQPAQTAREGEPECDRWHAGPSELLQNVHFFRVLSWAEQLAVCNMLPSFLEEHPQVLECRWTVMASVSSFALCLVTHDLRPFRGQEEQEQ